MAKENHSERHLTPTRRSVKLTCVPQSSYVEALTPSVTIFGDKAFCCSVAKSCLTLGSLMDCSTSGSPVLHCLPEFALIHVH